MNASGNLVALGSDSFAYDQANRLKSVAIGGATTLLYSGLRLQLAVIGEAQVEIMDVLNTEFNLKLTINRHKISFETSRTPEDNLRVEVSIDGRLIGELELSARYLPGVAVGQSDMLIWGGTRAYALSPADQRLTRLSLSDADLIDEAYIVKDRWVFVCELSVVVFNSSTASQVARYDQDEILVRDWWSGDRLIVDDFEGRRIYFEPLEDDNRLTPHRMD